MHTHTHPPTHTHTCSYINDCRDPAEHNVEFIKMPSEGRAEVSARACSCACVCRSVCPVRVHRRTHARAHTHTHSHTHTGGGYAGHSRGRRDLRRLWQVPALFLVVLPVVSQVVVGLGCPRCCWRTRTRAFRSTASLCAQSRTVLSCWGFPSPRPRENFHVGTRADTRVVARIDTQK